MCIHIHTCIHMYIYIYVYTHILLYTHKSVSESSCGRIDSETGALSCQEGVGKRARCEYATKIYTPPPIHVYSV